MIDTVTLRLTEKDFRVVEHQSFSPNTYGFFNPPYTRMGARGYIDAVNNPTKADYLKGIYKPQLTLRKKFINGTAEIYLLVQFSVPKLRFLNNFDEISSKDLDDIILKLRLALETMGIITDAQTLRRALVVKVHFSKNIPLPQFVIPYSIIKEVAKVDLTLRYDLSEKDYRNSGDSVRFRTNTFEVILYDKKKDLKKTKVSEKRAIEKENAVQLNLFESINKTKNFEVLRLEVRYNNNQKIKSVFKKELHLEDLFDEQLAMSVLQETWQEILTGHQFVSQDISNKGKEFTAIKANNPSIKVKTLLSAHAFLAFSQALGVRQFRKIVEAYYSTQTWYALKRSVSKLNLPTKEAKNLYYIRDYLSSYKPLALKNYIDTSNK